MAEFRPTAQMREFDVRYLIVLFLLLSSPACAEKRVAFLVGNSNYEHAPSLRNPGGDSELIAETLEGLDFEVERHRDLNRDEIGRELTSFLRKTKDADVTLFYFAGHGMQFEGRNYLVGTDARLETEFDIEGEALQLNRVVQLLERNSRAALIFVDACRDNPLANQFYKENFSQTRALATRGLAPISTSFQGSMITFSASPGQVAYDGSGQNSPFAEALARHLPTENLEVLSLMKRVIRDVKLKTNNLQTPMVTNDLTAEIYLKFGSDGAGATLAFQQEQALFEAASDLDSLRAWNIFLERYPNGTMRDIALTAREAIQVEEVAASAGVEVADLTPKSFNRDIAAVIEEQLGLSNDDIRSVQAALLRLGYDAGPPDGVMGQRTRVAIANFQVAAGLTATGAVSQSTGEMLGLKISRTETVDQPIVSSRDARKYSSDLLALVESDDRLLNAVRMLGSEDIVYGIFDGRVYIAVLNWEHITWDDAVALSEKAGGHLVTITSAAENQFVFDLIMRDDRFWVQSNVGTRLSEALGPHIGLYQEDGAREPAGGWRWVTNEPLIYSNWKGKNPDNYADREHQAMFYNNEPWKGSNAKTPPAPVWNDIQSGMRSFIIEIE